MDKIKELRAQAEELIGKMKALLDKADEEKRDLSEAETTEYADLEKRHDKLAADIVRREKLLEDEAKIAESGDKPYKVNIRSKRQNDRPKEWRDAKDPNAIGEFLYAVCYDRNDPRLQDCNYVEFREQSMGTGTEGGFAVPEQFRPQLLQVQPAEAIFEPRATVIPAGDPPDAKITMPALDQTSAENVYGGVVMYKVGEGKALTESDVALKEVSLEPQGLGGYVTVTNKLLQNWQAAGSLIANQLRKALIGYKDTQFYNGNGVAGPLGILNAPAAIKVNRTTASQVVAADIRSMIARMKMGGNYLWVGSQTIITYLSAMVDAGSNMIFHTDYTKPVPNTLMGIPLMFHDRSVALGTEGDLILVDAAYYLIKQGSGPYVASDGGIVNFTSNKTLIKIIDNVDGKPWLSAPLPLEGSTSNTVSPFVILSNAS
jgi:HK97 family phage major capsid protein